MSEIWRHLKFDFRRYGWLAAAALGVLILSQWLGLGLLVIGIVPLLVMNHKTAGSQAWWLVRPLNRTSLWLAKSIGIVGLCFGAMVAMSVGPVVQGVHPVFAACCKVELLPFLVAACAFTAVLAALSPDLRRYFLVLPAVLIAASCFVALWVQLAEFIADRNPGVGVLRLFPSVPKKEFDAWLLIALFSAAGLFVSFLLQFRKRWPVRTFALAVVAILVPIYLGNVVNLTPFYMVIGRLQGRSMTPREIRPIAGHIALLESDLVAERVNRLPAQPGWRVRLPFRIHLDEDLPPNVYLETYAGFRFSSSDGPNPVEGRAVQNPFGRWDFRQKRALVEAAGVEPANPLNSGRENWALFDLPDDAKIEDWMGRRLTLSEPQDCRAGLTRTQFVGALDFVEGARLIIGGERYTISLVTNRNGQSGLALTSDTLLEPRSGLNPARRWGGAGGRNAFLLWDTLESEVHFAEQGIMLETRPGGEGQFSSGFSTLQDRTFSASRLGDFKILVLRQEWIETRMIEIKAATFTFRLPPEASEGQ